MVPNGRSRIETLCLGDGAPEGVVVHRVGHVVGVGVQRQARVHQALRGAEDQVGAGGELAVQVALALGLGWREAGIGAVFVDHVVDDQARVELVDPVLLAGAEEPEDGGGGRMVNGELVNW